MISVEERACGPSSTIAKASGVTSRMVEISWQDS